MSVSVEGFPYAIGDAVKIDGDDTLRAVVVALLWREPNPEIQVSWIAEGNIRSEWLPLWRLGKQEARPEYVVSFGGGRKTKGKS